jgi:hypothetical protein
MTEERLAWVGERQRKMREDEKEECKMGSVLEGVTITVSSMSLDLWSWDVRLESGDSNVKS